MKTVLKVIFILLSLCVVPDADAQEQTLDPVAEFLETPGVDAKATGIYVLDLQSGEVIGEHNADSPLTPASVMKCVTTASLLDQVGQDWVYETPVFATGPVRDGVLEGDILVEGSADPSVNSRNACGSPDLVMEIVRSVRHAGVDTIRGRILVDESAFAGPAVNSTWMRADLSEDYGTGTHAFNFEDNANGSRSVSDPKEVFVRRLKDLLDRNGIVVQENPDLKGRDGNLLGIHRSAEIREIMRSCMMRSDNQFAESMLRTYSRQRGGDGSVQDGADAEIFFWKRNRMPVEGVRIVDGSGLSRTNRLTPVFLGRLLAKMSSNPYYASFFPLAGYEGTLRRFGTGSRLEGYAALKTGSMRGIQSYAGYLLNDDYEPTHVIVIMMNNLGDRRGARRALQRMLERMLWPEDFVAAEEDITQENEDDE